LVGVQERMDKLEKYYDKVVFRCLFESWKTSDKKTRVVEIKMNVPDDFLVKNNVKRLKRQLS
jgi:putative sigma-54 modulation protein